MTTDVYIDVLDEGDGLRRLRISLPEGIDPTDGRRLVRFLRHIADRFERDLDAEATDLHELETIMHAGGPDPTK
jgi:hypothetical protein